MPGNNGQQWVGDSPLESTRPGSASRKVAAVGDLHCRESSRGAIGPLFRGVEEQAEVLLLCGDLCDHGTANEAEVLAGELAGVVIPMVAVLGNHDFERGQPDAVRKILEQAGVNVLDGESWVLDQGLGFAGVKGFGGGFGDHVLQAWGEDRTKDFVMAAQDEAMKLEGALARLNTDKRVVLLHYSPLKETLVGEPLEIYSFLGTSRLKVPIDRFRVDVAFHGHAHRGSPFAHTERGVPVYNCAFPLLRRQDLPVNYVVVEL